MSDEPATLESSSLIACNCKTPTASLAHHAQVTPPRTAHAPRRRTHRLTATAGGNGLDRSVPIRHVAASETHRWRRNEQRAVVPPARAGVPRGGTRAVTSARQAPRARGRPVTAPGPPRPRSACSYAASAGAHAESHGNLRPFLAFYARCRPGRARGPWGRSARPHGRGVASCCVSGACSHHGPRTDPQIGGPWPWGRAAHGRAWPWSAAGAVASWCAGYISLVHARTTGRSADSLYNCCSAAAETTPVGSEKGKESCMRASSIVQERLSSRALPGSLSM